MTRMNEEEWRRVQETLVRGGLRECIDDLLASRSPVPLTDENRKIIQEAYDDGDGNTLTLVPTDDPPWFAGMYEGSELMQGMEHDGTLYSIVYASGGGLVSVVVGDGLITNEMGLALHSVSEAKAYVQGLLAQ